jgi:hypothetical protein
MGSRWLENRLDECLDYVNASRNGKTRKIETIVNVLLFLNSVVTFCAMFLLLIVVIVFASKISVLGSQGTAPIEGSATAEKSDDPNYSFLTDLLKWLAMGCLWTHVCALRTRRFYEWLGSWNDENSFFTKKCRRLFRILHPSSNFPPITTIKTETPFVFCEGLNRMPSLPACHIVAQTVFSVMSNFDRKIEDDEDGNELETESESKLMVVTYGKNAKANKSEDKKYPILNYDYLHVHSFLYHDNGILCQSYVDGIDSYVPVLIDLRSLSFSFNLRSLSFSFKSRLERRSKPRSEENEPEGEFKEDLFDVMQRANTPLFRFLISKDENKFDLSEDRGEGGIYDLLTNLNEIDYELLCLPQSAQGDLEFLQQQQKVFCCETKIEKLRCKTQ